jgi:hypothetical protein
MVKGTPLTWLNKNEVQLYFHNKIFQPLIHESTVTPLLLFKASRILIQPTKISKKIYLFIS